MDRASSLSYRCESMLSRGVWRTISPHDYQLAFERFGGSFAVHPRVVALLASLARRPVRYAGLTHRGELVAAVPLWGEHIVATQLTLEFYEAMHLIDIGDSEIVLPIAEGVSIDLPFKANLISPLHVNNVANVQRETDFAMTLAKGVETGDHRLSAKSRARRRRELRRLEDVGGRFVPMSELSPKAAAAIYTQLFEKRWGFPALGKDLLPTVLSELADMLCGDALFVDDRAAAVQLVYQTSTPHFLLANGVNRGLDPAFRGYSPGSTLLFHNIARLEEVAKTSGKVLRFGFGLNDADYKELWTFETPAYRLEPPSPRKWSDLLDLDALTTALRGRKRRTSPLVESN